MGVRLRSLSEDFTDACSHTWSVAFFLILALILLLTPPPPTSSPPSSPSPTINKKNSNLDFHQPQKPQPEHDVTCWVPAQFEQSQVDYSNRICSLRFDAWLHGKPQPMIPSADPYYTDDVDYSKNETKENNKNIKNNNVDVDSDDNDKADGQSSSEEMSRIKTPVLLFILAIGLRIPGMLWSVMSRCCNGNGFNVGRTLESAEKGDVMSLDGRRQMYAGLFRAIQKHTRRSGKTVTGLYLFMKAVMILVLVAEILVVTVHVLPQQRHDDPGVVAAAAGHGMTDSIAKLTTSSSSSSSSSSSPSSKPRIPESGLSQTDRMEFLKGSKDNAIFYCSFKTRNMQVVHEFTVQCIVQQQKQQLQQQQKQQLQQQQKQLQDERQELFRPLIQSNVFLIALVSLVFLLIFNVVSALAWLAVLANQSTRTGLGLRPDSPLDLVFLLQMARDNLSVGVATGLVDSVRDEEATKGCEEEGGLVQKVL